MELFLDLVGLVAAAIYLIIALVLLAFGCGHDFDEED